MSRKHCPQCGFPLKIHKNVTFTKPHGLTKEEFKKCVWMGIRYDCIKCSMAFLFFSKKIYCWAQTGEKDEFENGWRDFTKYGEVKVQFT
jgi:hypothetical protein